MPAACLMTSSVKYVCESNSNDLYYTDHDVATFSDCLRNPWEQFFLWVSLCIELVKFIQEPFTATLWQALYILFLAGNQLYELKSNRIGCCGGGGG